MNHVFRRRNSVALSIALSLMARPAFSGDGYDAGYRWAAQEGVDDPSYCYSRTGGYINNSPSFTEGCLDYLRDEGLIDEDDEPVEIEE